MSGECGWVSVQPRFRENYSSDDTGHDDGISERKVAHSDQSLIRSRCARVQTIISCHPQRFRLRKTVEVQATVRSYLRPLVGSAFCELAVFGSCRSGKPVGSGQQHVLDFAGYRLGLHQVDLFGRRTKTGPDLRHSSLVRSLRGLSTRRRHLAAPVVDSITT